MSYLESRLNQIDENILAPAKEGGLAALSGKKYPEIYGHQIHTVPLFHHSFYLLKQSVQNQSMLIMQQVEQRCTNKCIVDLQMTYGENIKNDYVSSQCQKECVAHASATFLHQSKQAEKDTNRIFNECLSQNVKKEVQYENVLACKKKAFNYYVEKSLDAEQELLTHALNKFA